MFACTMLVTSVIPSSTHTHTHTHTHARTHTHTHTPHTHTHTHTHARTHHTHTLSLLECYSFTLILHYSNLNQFILDIISYHLLTDTYQPTHFAAMFTNERYRPKVIRYHLIPTIQCNSGFVWLVDVSMNY